MDRDRVAPQTSPKSSAQERLEKTKRDFVSNVSHELRTPLTAIKGFVETLLDEEKNPSKRRYFEIINRNTDRLIAIINDLLNLSRLENKGTFLELEQVSLADLLPRLMVLFEKRAHDKKIALSLKVEKNLPSVRADAFKLEQLFINLLDNALKYTDHGSIVLELLRCPEKGDHLLFRICDTGIGVPRKHQQRIFDRFYVVNKSRSRLNGGTGLGLSIVKHIVSLHRGEMSLTSEVGKGTCIAVRLPI